MKAETSRQSLTCGDKGGRRSGASSAVAIITTFFLFAMISFVTNLAAPIGVIWRSQPEVGGSNMLGIMGNFMNFLAYLFMGIPAGNMLLKMGYKRTELVGMAVGFVGVFIQYLSGLSYGVLGFCIYLLGAFVSGFAVCILNTVVNPMLNLLGGGGKRGNQLCMVGGTFYSLTGTLTPMLVGALIGTVSASTHISDVNLVLYIAMTVFALAFAIIWFIPIEDPDKGRVTEKTRFEHSPWAFRHFLLGVIAIFVYVGVEVGIPGGVNFYLTDTSASGAWVHPEEVSNAATIGGAVAAMYWLLMLVGRFIAGFVAGRVSSRTLMLFTTSVGMFLLFAAIVCPKTNTVTMPLFDVVAFSLSSVVVPMSVLLLVLCGLCTSVLWPCIFNLATEGLGKYTAQASGIFMMMVVGGGVLPVVQNYFADHFGYMPSYLVYLVCMAIMFCYALVGCKNVNQDIPV